MLVSFPTNVHKLSPDKEIPCYGRFVRKGKKQVKSKN